ncbi:MAG: VOC family protein [Edaphobacter sp.]
MQLNAYLNFGGNCEEAFRFYEKNLGGKINAMMRYADQPDPKNAPPGTEKFVLYANMSIAGTEVMGSDVAPGRFEPMRSVYLSLGVDSDEEAERVYGLLKEGGELFMTMSETFFAFRFAMLRDKFGTSWMIIHQRPMPGA